MNVTNEMDSKYYNSYNGRELGYSHYDNKLEYYGLTAQMGIKYEF